MIPVSSLYSRISPARIDLNFNSFVAYKALLPPSGSDESHRPYNASHACGNPPRCPECKTSHKESIFPLVPISSELSEIEITHLSHKSQTLNNSVSAERISFELSHSLQLYFQGHLLDHFQRQRLIFSFLEADEKKRFPFVFLHCATGMNSSF